MTVKQKLQEEIRALKAELLAAGKTARINATNNTELANLVTKLTEANAALVAENERLWAMLDDANHIRFPLPGFGAFYKRHEI